VSGFTGFTLVNLSVFGFTGFTHNRLKSVKSNNKTDSLKTTQTGQDWTIEPSDETGQKTRQDKTRKPQDKETGQKTYIVIPGSPPNEGCLFIAFE
jgi:hypothetical protein